MLNKIKLCILACKIEYHWKFITPGRKKANRIIEVLLEQGREPLDSPELAALYRRLNKNCTRVSALTYKYNELAGILPLG